MSARRKRKLGDLHDRPYRHPHRRSPDVLLRVSAFGDELYSDSGFSSVLHCIAASVEGFGDEVRAAEMAFRGIVSGTYTLHTLATKPGEIAQHAVNTANTIYAVETGDRA